LDVDRVQAAQSGLTQKDVTDTVLVALSSTNQVAPNYWVNPKNRVNYVMAVQTPPNKIHTVEALLNTPVIKGQTAQDQSPQLLNNLVTLRRGKSETVVNHYNVQPVYEIYANVQGRDLGSVSADIQRVVDANRPNLPRGTTVAVRGQVESMNTS